MTALRRLINDIFLSTSAWPQQNKDDALAKYFESETDTQIRAFVESIQNLDAKSMLKVLNPYAQEIETLTIAQAVEMDGGRAGILFETDEGSFQYAGIDEQGNHKFTKFGSRNLIDLDLNIKCRAIF